MTNLSLLTIAELNAALDAVSAKRKQFVRVTSEGYDNGTPFDAELNAIAAELSTRKHASAEAAFVAEWTIDVFSARRAAWNAEMAKLPKSAKGIAWADIRALEAKLGFTMDEIKKAKAMLGIA